MSEQDLLLRFPVKIYLVQSCYSVQHQLLYQSDRHFVNWDISVISAFLPSYHFLPLSLWNKHLACFISISFALQVWGGLIDMSLIKCKTLVLKVCCSHFSPREADAPSILLSPAVSVGNKALLLLQTFLGSADLHFMPFVCLDLCSNNLG